MGMGGIHYCTIPGLGDSIFVVTPESCDEHYVFPVARDLREFLQLVAALDGTQLIDQIPLFGKEDFESALSEHKRICGDDAATDRERLEKTFELEPLARSPTTPLWSCTGRLTIRAYSIRRNIMTRWGWIGNIPHPPDRSRNAVAFFGLCAF